MPSRLPNLQAIAGLSSPTWRLIDLSDNACHELCPADSRRWALFVYPSRFGSATIGTTFDDALSDGIPVEQNSPLLWVYNDLMTMVQQQLFIRSQEATVKVVVIEAFILKTEQDSEIQGA